MFDFDIGKLGEDFEHVLADKLGHAVGIVDELVVFAAEEQAAVGAEAVVVEDVAVVADGHVVADEFFGAFAQRFGGDDEGADGDGFFFQRLEFLMQTGVGVDGIHEVLTFDAAVRGMDEPAALIGFDTGHRGLFENLSACFGGGAGDAQGVVERMEVAGMGVELCAQVYTAGKLLLERGFIPELVMGSAVMLSGVFMPLLQFFPMLRADGDGGIAALPVAGDLMFFNPFVNEFDGLQGLLPKPAGLFQADFSISSIPQA